MRACEGVDYVLKQAAWGSVPRSIEMPLFYCANNITGTLNMLEAARRNGIKRFVYASSSVYGDEPKLPKTEGTEGNLLSPYALTKRCDEERAKQYTRHYGLETVGLRYFNDFGHRQSPDGAYAAVIPKFIKQLLSGERPDLVRVIHKKNGGLSSARNAGIDNAHGEFIVFPDPDDWAEPNYVASFLECQRRYQTDLVCLGHYVDSDAVSQPGYPDAEPVTMTGHEARRGLLLPPRMQGFSWNKLYRLDIIRILRLRFPDGMGTTEDLFFAYQYLAHAQIVCHAPGMRGYHYCQRKNSFTTAAFPMTRLELSELMSTLSQTVRLGIRNWRTASPVRFARLLST